MGVSLTSIAESFWASGAGVRIRALGLRAMHWRAGRG
jgi:hypothetical protein